MRPPSGDTGIVYDVTHHGSISVVRPLNAFTRVVIRTLVAGNAQFWDDGVVVEPRYLADFLHGLDNYQSVD